MLETNHKGPSTTLFKALLGTLLVGGTVLTANSAQAVSWVPTPPIGGATGFQCLLNNSDCFKDTVVLGDKALTLISRTTLVAANNDEVRFTLDPTNVNTPYQVALDFFPNRNNILNDVGNLRYKIAINGPLHFSQVKLANQGDITNGAYSVTKTFWNSDYTVQVIPDTLVNPITPDGIDISSLGLQTLYVQDEWNVKPTANGSITSIQNSFGQVPGPLPLVGVGAAFGLSRRIRSRIKGARLA
jgi:hypothetical protein